MEHTSLHSPHHSVVHIARLVREGRAAADPHLSSCQLCAETARLLEIASPASPPAQSGAPVSHLADPELTALVLDPNPAQAREQLLHVAQCGSCAARLEALSEIFSDDPVEPPVLLRSATSGWRRAMAQRIARMKQRPANVWPKYAAIAASLLVVTAVGYRAIVKSGPEELLAEAYTQSRPFDYRLPDKGYARVSQKMSAGGTFDKPPALIRAQAEISTRLSDALVARGRAELLNGDLDAAIATLERARETLPAIETVALDLACAYAARGDASHPEDYAKALDLLERLLRVRPGDPAAWFNRSLVLERMQRFDDAEHSWDQYLKSDPSGPWADEARQRRNAAGQKKSTAKRP